MKAKRLAAGLLAGQGELSDYQFGKKHSHHPFCRVCGVRAFSRRTALDSGRVTWRPAILEGNCRVSFQFNFHKPKLMVVRVYDIVRNASTTRIGNADL